MERKIYRRLIIGYRALTMLLVLFFVLGGEAYAQALVPFTPRKSTQTIGKYYNVPTYKLQGDFHLIGNTNQVPQNYDVNKDNRQAMFFADVDSDTGTINSSLAELKLQQPCAEVVFAGLYWVGTTVYNAAGSVVVNGKTLYRNKIKLKHANKPTYENLTADVMFPEGASRFYGGYVDVTNYVRANGGGNYYVADIANDLNPTDNKVGGWGMVVIYRDTSLPWKEITVFDGLIVNDVSHTNDFSVNGFRTPPAGNVNVNVGYLAMEGDKFFTGDYFSIENAAKTSFVKVKHSANTVDNFFNSSIFPNDYNRSPKITDNLGIDVVKFKLDNTNNSLIKNNDTGTRIRIGTTDDGYNLYLLVFGIDSYVPDIIAENKIATPGVVDGGTVSTGQNLQWNLTIRNNGSEAVGNGKVEIPIPSNLHYVSGSIDQTKLVKGSVTWVPPAGAGAGATSTNTPGGKLVWNFGADVPVAVTTTILGSLTYNLRVIDCALFLTTANSACVSTFSINGNVTGIGRVTGGNMNESVVKSPGLCGTGGRDETNFTAKVTATANCGGVVNGVRVFETYCSNPVNTAKRADILGVYPPGTKFYRSIPGTANYLTTEVTGDFASSTAGTMYYALLPGVSEGCYLKLSITAKTITTSPITNNVSFCVGQPVVLNNRVSTAGLKLYYYTSGVGGTPTTVPPSPEQAVVHTYYVAEGQFINGSDCIGPRKAFTISISYCPFEARINPNMSIEKK